MRFRGKNKARQFEQWLSENADLLPHVLDAVDDCLHRYGTVSINWVWETLRLDPTVRKPVRRQLMGHDELGGRLKPYAMPNDYRAYLARLLLVVRPELAEHFELRQQGRPYDAHEAFHHRLPDHVRVALCGGREPTLSVPVENLVFSDTATEPHDDDLDALFDEIFAG